jgi:hypothetical protein
MNPPATELLNEFVEGTELTESKRHEVLANEERRITLQVLADRSTTATPRDIAPEVASRKSESGTLDSEIISSVEVALHHIHLPKLDVCDIIEYNPNSRRIEI